jgi:hypothetical protein
MDDHSQSLPRVPMLAGARCPSLCLSIQVHIPGNTRFMDNGHPFRKGFAIILEISPNFDISTILYQFNAFLSMHCAHIPIDLNYTQQNLDCCMVCAKTNP